MNRRTDSFKTIDTTTEANPTNARLGRVLVLEANAAARDVILEATESLGLVAEICRDASHCVNRLQGDDTIGIVSSLDAAVNQYPALLDLLEDRIYAPPVVLVLPEPLAATSERLARRGVWDLLALPMNANQLRRTLGTAAAEGRKRLEDRQCVRDFRLRLSELSRDERVVLEAVCEGQLNKQIAREQGVSVRTIEQRRRRVFAKMNVVSAVPLARRMATVHTLERMTRPRHHHPASVFHSA